MTPIPITVVVPTVERPDELARCLDAILGGEVLPSEVLVIDQGGLGGTADVIAAHTNDDLTVRHVRTSQRGLSAARNTGLALVATPWVAFTDDDCVPGGSWLSAARRRLRGSDVPDGVTGRVLPRGAATAGMHTLSLRTSSDAAVYRGRALPWQVGTGGNMVLNTELLRRVGGYDQRLGAGSAGLAGEDLEIVHRLLRSGATLAFDPDVLVHHDRVTAERRLATRHSYGFGMGAFAGVWLRSDPWVSVAMGQWLAAQARAAVGAARHGDRWRLREQRLMVRGAAAGVRYGWALRSPVGLDRATSSPLPGFSSDGGVDVE